jgi:hypothetical protein
VREAVPPTIVFFVGFNFILLTTICDRAQQFYGRDSGGACCRQGGAGRQQNVIAATLRSRCSDPANSF